MTTEIKPKYGQKMFAVRNRGDPSKFYECQSILAELPDEETPDVFVFTPAQFAKEISEREEAAARKAFLRAQEMFATWEDGSRAEKFFSDYWQSQKSKGKEGE